MHKDVEKLILVQACDGEIARMTAEIAAFPGHLKTIDGRVEAARAAGASAAASLKAEEVKRRSQESDVKDQQLRIAKLKKQIDTVQNDAQYKALQHEISFAEEAIRKLEDEELESMERTEGFEVAKAKAAETLENESAQLERERARAQQTTVDHETKLVYLREERLRVRAEVGERALAVYDRVSGAKKTGVAAAWDQKCSACQMMVRPQKWNELRTIDDEDPMTCETCGRMLYYDVGHGTEQSRERLALARLAGLGSDLG